MMDMINAPFVQEVAQLAEDMYRLGWHERNSGNISYLLTPEEAEAWLASANVLRTFEIGFEAKQLAGKYFVVTGAGKYFKNALRAPEENLGILRISEDCAYTDQN